MARRCVFCDKERKMTSEHAWPDWVIERWGPGDYTHVFSNEEGLERDYRASTLEVRVKRVCEVCNHGWMSDLENGTKRLLVWLMEARSLYLSPEDQAQVALWATKTAMMLGFTHPRRRKIPDTDYHYLYKHREPPPFTSVWLARYSRIPENPFYRHYGLELVTVSGRSGNAYVATMCIQQLVLRVFGHDLGEDMLLAPRDTAMVQVERVIRPATNRCSWPPSSALDANGLLAYADAFTED
jgi:hypothetical protein